MAKEKVLIVDDEVDVLDLCKRILMSQGYRVESAHNGYEAIDVASSKKFDLLLTDIKMPGMTGLEIAQHLKEADPSIICVTMTGFSTMDMAINALKLGIDEFILKPFTPKELSAAISKALEKERLRKENFRLRSLIPLFELNKTLMSTVEEDNLLNRVLEIALEETNASFAGIYLLQYDTITRSICRNLAFQQQETGRQLAKLIIQEKVPPKMSLEHALPDCRRFLETLNASSIIAAPLKSQNAHLGVLILGRVDSQFAPSDGELLSVLCGQASIALENARLFSEKEKAYEELKQLDHMKSEFINIAAHELRTPLAILMGYATVLEEDSPEDQLLFISNITRNAMRLRALIDDMLSLQYLESGVPPHAQDTLNLREVVQEVTQDVALLVEKKQLDFILNIPPDFPEMTIDRQKLDLILVNIIHNAVKFTPPEGKVTFKSDVDGEYALISVHNTGSVIPQKQLNKIFERFYQIEASLTREHGGAGLGLSIARGMINVCGGDISVASSEVEGTTFSFNLPLDNSNLEARKLLL